MQSQFQYTPLKDALLTLAGELGQRSRIESVNVREGYGRILAEDVLAGEDSPRSDVSHFDGFALRSEDTFGAKEGSQISLALRRGAGRPGLPAKRKLGTGEAMKVLTGGFLPPGADAIVPLEDSSVLAHEIQLTRPVHPGEHVYRAGSDVKKGDRILQAGKQLMGQDLVLLASLHIGAVAAYRRPRVAVLPTGSELTRDISGGRKGKVVESHSLLLELLIEGAGGLPTTLPIARDERRTLTRAIREAIRRSDIVFTLAGSSVGEPDLVESTIRGFGKATTTLVHGVRVNRGRVMGFAIVKGKPVVILPGPIQGALNAFIVLGYPLIRYHLGKGLEQPPALVATMGEDWDATGKFKDFDQVVYLRLTKDPATGGLLALPSSGETEKVSFLVSKNAYALVPGGDAHLAKGDRIEARLLPGFSRLD